MKFERKYSDSLVYDLGVYIARTGCTVRQCAAEFGVCKSSVFKYIKTRLPEIDINVSSEVEIVLQMNKEARSIRGGLATKTKWHTIRNQKSQKGGVE